MRWGRKEGLCKGEGLEELTKHSLEREREGVGGGGMGGGGTRGSHEGNDSRVGGCFRLQAGPGRGVLGNAHELHASDTHGHPQVPPSLVVHAGGYGQESQRVAAAGVPPSAVQASVNIGRRRAPARAAARCVGGQRRVCLQPGGMFAIGAGGCCCWVCLEGRVLRQRQACNDQWGKKKTGTVHLVQGLRMLKQAKSGCVIRVKSKAALQALDSLRGCSCHSTMQQAGWPLLPHRQHVRLR